MPPIGGPYKSEGSVLGLPCASRIHPSGNFSPCSLYKRILPSGAAAVEKSATIGNSLFVGTAKEMGFVERRPSRPPQGSTKCPWRGELHTAKAMNPSSAAR